MQTKSVSGQDTTDVAHKKLVINEIFLSIQGETSKTGLPTAFIRLTGCPLRCQYCDTEYAFHEGSNMTIAEVMSSIENYHTPHITVTGGEPLAQKACYDLLSQLCNQSYQVSLETSGAMDISQVDKRVVVVLDLKTPGSGEMDKNSLDNIQLLKKSDQVKFVICNHDDYAWAKEFIIIHKLSTICSILFSPSHTQLEAAQLADWILEDKLPVRLQVQLHKYLWGDARGR